MSNVAKFTANRKALVNRVKSLCRFVPKRSPKAILQNLRVSVNGTVELSGTDCESYCVSQNDELSKAGDRIALVPAQSFLKALQSIKAPEVTCEMESSTLTIRAGSSALSIPMDIDGKPDEYPVMPECQATLQILADAKSLAAGLAETLYACDSESTRYSLGGVLFAFEHEANDPAPHDGKLTLVATDTRRLAVYPVGAIGVETCIPEDTSAFARVVLSESFLTAILPYLKDAGSVVTIRIAPNVVEFSGLGWRATTYVVQGRFPKYETVIPETCNRQIAFRRDDLASALESVKSATSEAQRGIDIKFGNKTGETLVTFRGKSYDKGESTAVCTAGHVILSSFVAGRFHPFGNAENRAKDDRKRVTREDYATFDPRYLLDYLKALPKSAEYVQFAFNDEESAMVITAQGSSAKYVAMPLSRDR